MATAIPEFTAAAEKHGNTVTALVAGVTALVQKHVAKGQDKDKALAAATATALSECFAYASQTSRQLIDVAPGEETKVFSVLLGLPAQSSKAAIAAEMQARHDVLVKNIGTYRVFSSRMSHSQTSFSTSDANSADAGVQLPYLYSKTISDPTPALHTGAVGAVVSKLRVLGALFRYQGQRTNFIGELIRPGSAFIAALGLPAEITGELAEAFLDCSDTFEQKTPSILWPTCDNEELYALLTPLPCSQVIDAMDRQLRPYRYGAQNARRVDLAAMQVGGTQPQNCGLFNAASRGHHATFASRLYFAPRSRQGAKVWAKSWLGPVPKNVALRFNGFTDKANAGSKSTFFSNLARACIDACLKRAGTLYFEVPRVLSELEPAEQSKLLNRLAQNPAYAFFDQPTEANRTALIGEILSRAARAGAESLKTDTEVLKGINVALHAALAEFDIEGL